MIKTEIKNYLDYGKVFCLSNGVIEAYVTIDLGPRIIRFGYMNGKNFMCDNRAASAPKDDKRFKEFFGKDKKWEIFGGHRIWVSPESYPESYYPDSDAVEYQVTENGAVFTPKPEVELGYQKQLEIKMDPDDANMQVITRVKNIGKASKEYSVWSMSVSATGGTLVVPMNSNDTGLLHNRNISVWPYTNLADSRVYFGEKYITLRQNPDVDKAFKIGLDLNNAEIYYCLGDDILRKSYETYHPYEKYPDNGCSFETYTCATFIEIEALSPLKTVNSNETLSLTEHWSLHKKPCEVDFTSDNSIETMINKL